jgi:hypothetical protein
MYFLPIYAITPYLSRSRQRGYCAISLSLSLPSTIPIYCLRRLLGSALLVLRLNFLLFWMLSSAIPHLCSCFFVWPIQVCFGLPLNISRVTSIDIAWFTMCSGGLRLMCPYHLICRSSTLEMTSVTPMLPQMRKLLILSLNVAPADHLSIHISVTSSRL